LLFSNLMIYYSIPKKHTTRLNFSYTNPVCTLQKHKIMLSSFCLVSSKLNNLSFFKNNRNNKK
uniref:Uncharacterized protein n=1 Tax=Poecilia reticulata TaxID=8081 RepID=A0A3P9Q1H2_POERE